MKNQNPDSKLAKKWACDTRTIRRWRQQGAPLNGSRDMIGWLAGRKHLPAGTAALLVESRRQSTAKHLAEDASLPTGAAEALRRLERMESKTYAALERAMSGGDPIEIKTARESWLRVSESLRRYDLAVEASRRHAGEILTRAEVEKLIRVFGIGLRGASAGFSTACVHLAGCQTPEQVSEVLCEAWEWLTTSVAATVPQQGLPGWMLEAFVRETALAGYDMAHVEAWAAALHETIRRGVDDAVNRYRARADAEKAWRNATTPEEKSARWSDFERLMHPIGN